MERNIGTSALAALVLLAIAAPVRAVEQESASPPAPLPLEWCIARGRAANPALDAALAAAEAAGRRVRPAGSLDDPRLAYAASNVPTGDFDFASTPLSGHQFGLSQKLPFPGLLSSRKRAARRRAEASAYGVEDQRLVTDGAVEMAWAELGFAQRALDITEHNIALLRQLAGTAESRYQVGNGLQQDVLRAQVELTALLQERLRRHEAIEIAAESPRRVRFPMRDWLLRALGVGILVFGLLPFGLHHGGEQLAEVGNDTLRDCDAGGHSWLRAAEWVARAMFVDARSHVGDPRRGSPCTVGSAGGRTQSPSTPATRRRRPVGLLPAGRERETSDLACSVCFPRAASNRLPRKRTSLLAQARNGPAAPLGVLLGPQPASPCS